MKIGITLNEVLRDYIGQLVYTYSKYINDVDIKEDDVTSFNLLDHFQFVSIDALNRFLYLEESLEIFGHADQLQNNIITHFNAFLMDMQDDEEHEIQIVSREVMRSIPSTFFFLSKLGCRADNIRFVKKYENKWDDVDVLITANPVALDNKPKDKISVKINCSYNKDSKADFELDSIVEFFKDSALRDKILNTKTTTYEEIE